MTADELFRVLELAIHDGYGHAEVMFDTEARKFDFHMASVDSAYLLTDFDPERPLITLHTKRVQE